MSSVKTKVRKTVLKLVFIAVAGIVTWLLAAQPTAPQGKQLTVDYLNVGQGDSILLTTPSGYQLLIDGGANQQVLSELNAVMGAGDQTIDMLMLSHPDADHLFGLVDVVRDYEVQTILMPDVAKTTAVYRAWTEGINHEGATLHIIKDRQTFTLPDGLLLTILSPTPQTYHEGEPANDASIVARFDYGQRSFLFTGDEEQQVEERLLAQPDLATLLDVDVLKVPHHGSKTSSTKAFIDAVSPSIAVISVGKDNKYGHPSALVLDRYERAYSRILRTDQLGRIRLSTDGQNIQWPKPCNPLQSLVFSCGSENVYTTDVAEKR